MQIQVVILAAGQGKRMYSSLPKVLHRLAGKPLLEHVIDTSATVTASAPIIVYGHEGEQVREGLKHKNLHWVEQKEQLGTGHALLQTLPEIADNSHVLVLYGDVPLISTQTLQKLITATPDGAIGMLTAHVANSGGYGRIKRDAANQVIGIVEEKDATPEERAITEINPGIYYVPVNYLRKWLPALKSNNAQGEHYLTDIIALAVEDNIAVHTEEPAMLEEILGVNDRAQLAYLERFYQRQYAGKLLRQGVTIYDPARLDIRGELTIGRDVVIDVNVIFEGRVVIGDGCVIGANSILRDVEIAENVEVRSHSIIEGAKIGADCIIGPFARIRPGTVLARRAHVGNFVEVKKSFIGEGSKANHLTYVGDSEIGKNVNLGAGTITCNYDGVNKHKTIIGDDAFIGSNSSLVAPVTIGAGATIGAGSTITREAPAHKLTLTRASQQTLQDWQRPAKKVDKITGDPK